MGEQKQQESKPQQPQEKPKQQQSKPEAKACEHPDVSDSAGVRTCLNPKCRASWSF